MMFPAVGGPTGTITGQVVYIHDDKPPKQTGLSLGRPVENAYVGLCDLNAGDMQVYTEPADANGNFTIANVPPGTYNMSLFDAHIHGIIDFRTVVVPPEGGTIAMGQVGINAWFGRMMGTIFNDVNQNGFRDPGEMGIPDQVVNVRYTDGSIYATTTTNADGDYLFDELYPLFRYQVVEVDSTRYKATGVTVTVDDGGTVDASGFIVRSRRLTPWATPSSTPIPATIFPAPPWARS